MCPHPQPRERSSKQGERGGNRESTRGGSAGARSAYSCSRHAQSRQQQRRSAVGRFGRATRNRECSLLVGIASAAHAADAEDKQPSAGEFIEVSQHLPMRRRRTGMDSWMSPRQVCRNPTPLGGEFKPRRSPIRLGWNPRASLPRVLCVWRPFWINVALPRHLSGRIEEGRAAQPANLCGMRRAQARRAGDSRVAHDQSVDLAPNERRSQAPATHRTPALSLETACACGSLD